MPRSLTDKQVRALTALAEPQSAQAWRFWAEARASWQGPRQTLGSLIRRGYATYERETSDWGITPEGREALRNEARARR
jgi:hypothetical protein